MITEQVYHHEIKACNDAIYFWKEETVVPFDELIISFNALRPQKGHYRISISLDGSHWFEYVYWSATEQRSYRHTTDSIHIDQDIIAPKKNEKTFTVRVEAKDGANLNEFIPCMGRFDKVFLNRSV